MEYIYKATVMRIIDGDTVDLDIDLGFHVSIKQRVRLAGIDTPEKTSSNRETRESAFKAMIRLKELIPENSTVSIQTFKSDKYGRMLAVILNDSLDKSVNQILLDEHLATEYNGGKK